MDKALIGKFLSQTRLLRRPKHLLSTFGATRIEYHLVSSVEDMPDKTRLRQGSVVSERPLILTPDSLRERFLGFGENASEFARWIDSEYAELLRALEYRFKNQGLSTRVLSEPPSRVSLRIKDDVDAREISQAAVLECPDAAWSLALMKLTLEEASRSFPVNVRDLDRRGLFGKGSP